MLVGAGTDFVPRETARMIGLTPPQRVFQHFFAGCKPQPFVYDAETEVEQQPVEMPDTLFGIFSF